MRRFAGFGILIAAMLVAQPGSKGATIQDSLGNHLKVTGMSSLLATRQTDGRVKIVAKTSPGNKITADWFTQGKRIVASGLTMFASKDFKLISAEMTGGISFTSKNPGASSETVVVEAPGASYTASTNTVTVDGHIDLERKGDGQNLTASGSSGTVVLNEGSKDDPVSTAQISGPVKFSMKGMRQDEGKKVPFNVHGTAGKMTYDQGDNVIRLTNGVNLSGNDPTLIGDISGVSTTTIHLTADREIESIEMEGDPGKTVIEQKSTTPPTKGGGKKKS